MEAYIIIIITIITITIITTIITIIIKIWTTCMCRRGPQGRDQLGATGSKTDGGRWRTKLSLMASSSYGTFDDNDDGEDDDENGCANGNDGD